MSTTATAPAVARNYKATRGQVGPFPAGHVFSFAEFVRLHPVPKDGGESGIDAETYHADLIDRLTVLGVVAGAGADDVPQPTPVGPEGRPPKGIRNPGIASAVADELRRREVEAAVADQAKQQANQRSKTDDSESGPSPVSAESAAAQAAAGGRRR